MSRRHAAASVLRTLPRLLPQLRRLRWRQQLRVCCFMSAVVNGEGAAAIVEQSRSASLRCPHCQQTAFSRHGKSNGLQRYRCRECRRTFNALTGTPLARLRHKSRWLAFLDCMRDPASTVHSAADQVGVHANTSFRWRHRFLQWVSIDRPAVLQGIVEAAHFVSPASRKGTQQRPQKEPARPHEPPADASLATPKPERETEPQARRTAGAIAIVFARDRSGGTIDFAVARGAIDAADLQTSLLPKLAKDVLLVSRECAPYLQFCRDNPISHHHPTPANTLHTSALHTTEVFAYHARFACWLAHFRGVASKYLARYLGWRWAIDLDRLGSAQCFLIAALGGNHSQR